jgi:hypothetical protein
MKALIVLFLATLPAFAQPLADPIDPVKPADAAQATTAAENPAPAAAEPWITGSIDLGYRFRTNLNGNSPAYQSIVDLSPGLRLMGLDFTIVDPKHRLFDWLNVRGNNWGGDPYNTAHVDAKKAGDYDFRFDYSNILYYNALPSYANPFAPGGFNQQWFNQYRKNIGMSLTLRPGKSIVPYVILDHNSGSGTGISNYAQGETDTFPVATTLADHTGNYRGGVRLEMHRFHVTLEEGGTTFRDNDSAYNVNPNLGDNTTTLFGQTLQLNNLAQSYAIRAHGYYSRALLTANPFSWLNTYAQFLYSEPKTTINYQDSATGNFVLLNSLLFYNSQTDVGTGSANKPHVAGNAGLEARPLRRLRVTGSWSTDRFHDSAYSSLAAVFLTQPVSTSVTTQLAPLEMVINNRAESMLYWDLTKRLTLRGGYRYEWGSATTLASEQSQIGLYESGRLRRQLALAGANFHPAEKLSMNADFEGASTTQAYFTTSLYNYTRLRARARYQVAPSLTLQANFAVLANHDPIVGSQYDSLSRDNSMSVNWTPKGGKVFAILAEYDRSSISSSIDYLLPSPFTADVSQYNANAHIATSAVQLNIPKVHGVEAKVTLGGSLAIVNGTEASRYYEPLARLSIPAGKHVYWNTEWRWYGYSDQLYLYQGFQTHLFQTGVKLFR